MLAPAVSAAAKVIQEHGEKTVTVGCSSFTEPLILDCVYSEFIESNTGLKVEQRFNLSGGVDMFVEFLADNGLLGTK